MLSFLSQGKKPRGRIKAFLDLSVSSDERITTNLVFQSVEKMSEIAQGYGVGQVIVVPFVNGAVNLGDLAEDRFEFNFDSNAATRETQRSELLSFLSPGINGKWPKSAAWRGLLEEAVCNTNNQLRVKNINLACRQAFDELVVGKSKTDRPRLIQFIVFSDGDQPNRLSELGQLLADFRNFCAQTGIWFEYHECCFRPSFDLSDVARESQKMIKESGCFVEDSADFTRSIRFYGPQDDSLKAELSAVSGGLTSKSSILVPFPFKVVSDDNRSASGSVNVSLGIPQNLTNLKLVLTKGTFQVASPGGTANLEINAEGLDDAFAAIKSQTEIDLRLLWKFVPDGKARSDDFVPTSVPLKLTLIPPPPQLVIKVRALKNQTANSQDSDTAVFDLNNIDPSREAISFQADFSGASRDSHLIVDGEANKSDVFVLNEGKNYLDLHNAPGDAVSFSVSANAKPGLTQGAYALNLRANDSSTLIIPHKIVLNATFTRPSVTVEFLDSNSAPLSEQPPLLDWHEVLEHQARRGTYKSAPPGEKFLVNVPTNLAANAGVTLTLDEDVTQAFELVRQVANSTNEEPFNNGGLVLQSSTFRIKLRNNLNEVKGQLTPYKGRLVIASSSEVVLLNGRADPLSIGLAVTLKHVNTVGN
jgi:hypothetical protein